MVKGDNIQLILLLFIILLLSFILGFVHFNWRQEEVDDKKRNKAIQILSFSSWIEEEEEHFQHGNNKAKSIFVCWIILSTCKFWRPVW